MSEIRFISDEIEVRAKYHCPNCDTLDWATMYQKDYEDGYGFTKCKCGQGIKVILEKDDIPVQEYIGVQESNGGRS